MPEELTPTGECWCGCGNPTPAKAFFVPGHDSTLEAAVVNINYGGRAGLAKAHGFGPGGKNAQAVMAEWREGRRQTK